MTVTNVQRHYIKTLLWRNIKYQETFEEVYDHVLTALEEKPQAEIAFELQVFQIINESFGSFKLLKEKEGERVNIIEEQVAKKFIANVRSQYNSKSIFMNIALYGLIVYLIEGCSGYTVDVLTYFLGLTPVAIIAIRHLSNLINQRKPSVKNEAVNWKALRFFFLIMFNLFVFVNSTPNMKVLSLTVSLLGAGLIMMFLAFTLSFIKLYREEFKMQII